MVLSPPVLQTHSHSRQFESNVYVYPVLSRRSGGLSIGINLNVDKVCNFDCIYCQVDRTGPPPVFRVPKTVSTLDIDRICAELDLLLQGLAPSGPLWQQTPFSALQGAQAVVRDIAFSGDGEPTTVLEFESIVKRVVEVRNLRGFAATKIVIITNATGLGSARVKRALAFLDDQNGEVWAKLDAGTTEWFQMVDQTRLSLDRIQNQIVACAKIRPVVIQTCLFRLNGYPPPDTEMEAYIDRLNSMVTNGAQIRTVHLYTVARPPAVSAVTPLPADTLRDLGTRVSNATGLSVETFP
ncbi:MAG: radical SAM protein [Myxococcales bacterium]|nr:radical SAM protein [Myxococcales bacterium]